ncbi:polyhydroxyalkanoate synthesis repressor PhaR [Beggiatoa leptomitoformis]|uniref:Polyhydroxyalkanoate synthesis repressor PhaR n=1 Tax=Beggiatoa leptomitoformis TaxID=288004 RepID=A0A2N9YGV6_9GAMM|nr:polyhydroxyalkanoate synthesis repressor PhaR [Beggiatoa leptomitoformis]ALG67980.1 polyhydroxyalkanoate synthesis repressor PhaR [Beggiatoa leptomitoformis]AUI69740.1 polyhydroxyalkanoate synthesis repressor PhaR [Beggiatoa leptomitoformis]
MQLNMTDAPDNSPRIIKKYPNRRLYDTAISSYITLDDVKSLVRDNVRFYIQDAKTGEDITRSILLQIILEQEAAGEPIFSSEVLAQLIRFYGDTLQGILASYFERSLGLFSKQQEDARAKMYNPISFMTDIAEQNITLWKDMQESFFRATLPNKSIDIGKDNKKNSSVDEDNKA